MANKTLYIRDNDEVLWQQAETLVTELGIESLSKLVSDALKKEVKRLNDLKELKSEVRKIIVTIANENGERKIGFNGKWLVENYEYYRALISVALTEKESYFVLWDNQGYHNDAYQVFEYYNDFINSDSIPSEVKSIVASGVGEDYIEFIDI